MIINEHAELLTRCTRRLEQEMKMTNARNTTEGNTKRSQKTTKPSLKWYWSLLGFGLLGYGAFVLLIPLWDSLGVETIRCEIRTAKPDTSSGGSRGSASTAGVLVETSNCGNIYISQGVTFDNQEEMATSFKPGSEYEFDLGWFSRVITKEISQEVPSVQDYRLVK